MNTAIRSLLTTLLVAVCLTTGLTAQEQSPAPGGETLHEYRDKALHEESARPSGAFGLDRTNPADTWLSGGEKTIKLVGAAILALLILRWLWKRRTVSYS